MRFYSLLLTRMTSLIWELYVAEGYFWQGVLGVAGIGDGQFWRDSSLLGGVPVDIGDVTVHAYGWELLQEEETELLSDPEPPGVPSFLIKGRHYQAPHTQMIWQEYGDEAPGVGLWLVVDLGNEEPEEEDEREVGKGVKAGGSGARSTERRGDVIGAEQDRSERYVVDDGNAADPQQDPQRDEDDLPAPHDELVRAQNQ